MPPKGGKGAKAPKAEPEPSEPVKEYPTIAAKLEAEYLASRRYIVLASIKGFSALTANEQAAYAASIFLESEAWRSWPEKEQAEFSKQCEKLRVPVPLPKPRDLGKDSRGRDIGTFTVEEYNSYLKVQRDLRRFTRESERFRERREDHKGREAVSEDEVEKERNRRKLIGVFEGKKMGRYEGDPEWDDVVPIPQDDGVNALAAIAYTDEYSEAMSYLRAVMAAQEHSPRVLALTSHIISLNAAHYTVWLYRATVLFALNSSIPAELEWVNDIALDNQKNYQIWHHRQLLVDHLYTSISDNRSSIEDLGQSERDFTDAMFEEDSKNYHVWSYRQWLVRKLDMFDHDELENIEEWLRADIRNNSAWSHRFFVVFSDPKISTMGSGPMEHDPAIPESIIEREIEFSKAATFEAPQSQSSWNYLKGVLRKAGRKLASMECFVGEFVKLGKGGEGGGEEDVKSSHALEFMADCWEEQGKKGDADRALRLLGDKYDRIRRNYWEYRRKGLETQGGEDSKVRDNVEEVTKTMAEVEV